MWLFTDPVDEFASGGFTPGLTSVTEMETAFKKGIDFSEAIRAITSIETKALSIQKTIGSGVVGGTEAFREKLTKIYFETSKIGASFTDVTDAMQGLYDGLGRMVEPSEEVTQQMVELSQSTGIASKTLGTMVADFMRLTFSQEKSGELIKKITDSARRGGVSVNAALTSFQKNYKQVEAFGFKNGVDGLNKMNTQALQLRTSVEEIGAAQLGQTFWDPEKAIEAAAGMSMLGGSIGGLSNPLQLMNMGANNVEKLQEELINLSASAYKINETTGEVETNFIAQQRLKAQLDTLGKGGEYEKFINLGKEAAKQKMILDDLAKSGLGNLFEGEGKTFTEEDKRLIASLSEVKDGKVSLNIPGFGKPIDDLKGALSSDTTAKAIKSALEEYQTAANQSEKDIALKSLSIEEQQAIDLRVIREAMIRSNQLGATGRQEVLNIAKELQQKGSATGTKAVNEVDEYLLEKGQGAKAKLVELYDNSEIFGENDTRSREAERKKKIQEGNDEFFGGGTKRLSTGKGEMFSFIEEDQALFAPNLDQKLGVLKDSYMKMKDFENSGLSQVVPKELPEVKLPRTESTQKTEVTETKVQKIEGSGSVNINVNITSSGNLADTLINDRRFKNDLEKEILHVIKNKDLLMVKKP